MLFKYMEELGNNAPTHVYIKETFNWFFQIKDTKNKKISNADAKSVNQKIMDAFAPLAGLNATCTRVVNSIEDLFK